MSFELFHSPIIVTGCAADKVGAQTCPTRPLIDTFGKELVIAEAFQQL